jgi:hypothetical protein
MMKITLEGGNYLISSLSGDNLNHIPIAKPGKELRLTDPMAAYYVAAAGGTWTKSSDLVSRFFILSSIILITVSGIPNRVVVTSHQCP